MPQKFSRVILPVNAGGGAVGSESDTRGNRPTGRPTAAWSCGESQPGNVKVAASVSITAERHVRTIVRRECPRQGAEV